MPSSSWLYTLPALILVLRLLKARPPPSREQILPPHQERVLLLGASSGVGRDLALAYAKRGARVCVYSLAAHGSTTSVTPQPSTSRQARASICVD
jgi:NADPH:quinone reductase-like Zn-dependent oxidoreductase